MGLPKISGYGRYSSDNYGAHTLRVSFDRLTLWYSYDTIVAFSGAGHDRTVRQNDWGPTTGKHLNWIDGGDKSSRIPGHEFEEQLEKVLVELGLSDRERKAA